MPSTRLLWTKHSSAKVRGSHESIYKNPREGRGGREGGEREGEKERGKEEEKRAGRPG